MTRNYAHGTHPSGSTSHSGDPHESPGNGGLSFPFVSLPPGHVLPIRQERSQFGSSGRMTALLAHAAAAIRAMLALPAVEACFLDTRAALRPFLGTRPRCSRRFHHARLPHVVRRQSPCASNIRGGPLPVKTSPCRVTVHLILLKSLALAGVERYRMEKRLFR